MMQAASLERTITGDDDTVDRGESETGLPSQLGGGQERWGGLPVTEISGSIEEIKALLPRFERRLTLLLPDTDKFRFRIPFVLDREEEIWTPLFVMCEVFCRSRRTELERAAADICAAKRAEPKRASVRAAKQQADALRDGERLLRDLMAICGAAVGVRTSEALRGLKELHNAPWRNYAGEGLTDIRLAELVRAFGVGPRQFKVDGKNLRGYLRSDLEEGLRAVGVPGEPATPLPARYDAARSGVTG